MAASTADGSSELVGDSEGCEQLSLCTLFFIEHVFI